jgi:sulfur relay (sulfurtransferase) DsrC/TusE family protein
VHEEITFTMAIVPFYTKMLSFDYKDVQTDSGCICIARHPGWNTEVITILLNAAQIALTSWGLTHFDFPETQFYLGRRFAEDTSPSL